MSESTGFVIATTVAFSLTFAILTSRLVAGFAGRSSLPRPAQIFVRPAAEERPLDLRTRFVRVLPELVVLLFFEAVALGLVLPSRDFSGWQTSILWLHVVFAAGWLLYLAKSVRRPYLE